MNQKKGILGLNTVKAFVIVLLSLAIVGVITLVILGSLNSGQLQTLTDIRNSTTVANESLAAVNETTVNLVGATTVRPICTVATVTNNTDGVVIASANYTVSGCTIAFSGGAGGLAVNNTAWDVDYVWTQVSSQPVDAITVNVSAGIENFFTNSVTFFALLAVVVIILIIALIIVVVNRFGGETGGAGGSPRGEPTL